VHFILRISLLAHNFLCVGNVKKAIAKISDHARSNNVTAAEAETALLSRGFTLDGGKGSHRVWRHPDGRKIVIATHGATLPSYIVRQIRELITL